MLLAGVLLIIPQDRNPGLIFRQKIYIAPLVFLLALGTLLLKKHKILQCSLLAVLAGLFLLPLSGLWNSGTSDQYILSGTIPWSDAFIHHLNTLRFLFGGTMAQSSAIRPLSLTFYAAILRVADNNFLLVYALTAMIVGGCIALTLPVIERKLGPIVAAFFFTNAFFFIRRLTGSFMTEPVAFALGGISALFFVKGIFEKRRVLTALGFLALSIALNVRPGAMFVLAFGGLWFFFLYPASKKDRWVWSAVMLAAMLIGFALSEFNKTQVYSSGETLSNDQAALYLYGLCAGGEDTYYSMVQPELTAYFGSDQLWQGVFRLCRQKLSEHPQNITHALNRIAEGVLIDPERGAFSYFEGGNARLVPVIQYGLMALWVLGFMTIFANRNELFNSFLLAMTAGIFIFHFVAPAYNYYRLRFDAPTNWVSGLVTGIGLRTLILFAVKRWRCAGELDTCFDPDSICWRIAAGVLGFFIFCWLIAPPLIKAFPFKRSAPLSLTCPQDETAVRTVVSAGNYVSLHSYDLEKPHAPDFHLLYVRPGMHDTSTRGMFDFIDSLDDPVMIIKSLDLDTFEDILLFAPLDIAENKTGEVAFCAQLMDPPIYQDYRFGVVSRAVQLAP